MHSSLHHSLPYADDDDDDDEYEDATWGEVLEACCVRTSQEWMRAAAGLCGVLFFMYFFLFGLELMGSGAKVMTGCTAGALFGDETNPVAGLTVGLMSTVLLQSSSTTTSIVVSLAGSAISVRQAIYMVMGANIGTTVTNTIVSLGQLGDADQLERAFAGATVHDMFNMMTVAVLFPLEIATGYLRRLTGLMVQHTFTTDGGLWEGPIRKFVAPLGDRIIRANKELLTAVAHGEGSCEEGDGFYPILCEPGEPSYNKCLQVGLIACDRERNTCPSFFQPNATVKEDKISGGVVFTLAVVMLFFCLFALLNILQRMLMGSSTRIVHKATNLNGYVNMALGCGLTLLVQSSSVVTSTLTPLVGIGVIKLNHMYPLTLGANIGSTITALLAAMVTEGTESIQVALCHLLFNLIGIAIFYPIPFMRAFPLQAARQLGKATRQWRGFPFVYIGFMFFLFPITSFGLSFLFSSGSMGLTVLGSFSVAIMVISCAYGFYWWSFQGGKRYCSDRFERRERVRLTLQNLPKDMEYIKAKIALLIEHTRLPDSEDDEASADDER